jgi:hypothetical protein
LNKKLIRMKKYILLTVFSMFFVASCTDSYEEINTDPTVLTEVGLELQLPEALASSAYNAGANQNRIAGLIMQQFGGVDAQQEAYMRYVLPENTCDNYWQFGLYAGVLRSCDVISKKAVVDGAPFYQAVADILMANQVGIGTSFFGDMPFSEAFQGTDNLRPTYDAQESVYNSVQGLLDGAVTTLSGLSGAGGYVGGDLIFDGDVNSWLKTAKGLKARYYLHTLKRNPGASGQALMNAQASLTSNADDANFVFGTATTNNYSLTKFGIERPSTLGISEEFSAMMDGDPRKDSYMEGLEFFNLTNPALRWAQNDSSVPLMSYTEVSFIIAELTARNGDDASGALATAIAASMELVGIADDGGYGAANSDLSGMSTDAAVEKILTEAYKAYYGYNFHETWSNWRRAGYPDISVRANGSSDFMSSLVIPQRLFYGDSESTANKANVEAAKAAQGGGLLDVPTWANQ